MAEEEALLLARYARMQDPDAFRGLVEAHQHMVFATCQRVLQNRADAEDAAQDCFFRLALKAGELTAPIAGWLHTVAVQRAIDILRRRRARLAHEAKAAPHPAAAEPSWEDIRGHVDEQIGRLPDRLRLPIVLYYLEGRKQEDVARELGISQPAVSDRLKRGVGELRKRLDKAGVRVSAGALAPLLSTNAMEFAPASLAGALSKIALAGVGGAGGAAAVGSGAVKGAVLAAAAAGGLLAAVWLVVWAAVTWTTGRPQGPAAPAPSQATAVRDASPGEMQSGIMGRRDTVVERTLGGNTAGAGMFIDLDTGELHDMPENVAEIGAMVAWMRSAGVDAFYSRIMSPGVLIGVDLAGVRLSEDAWELAERGALDVFSVPTRTEEAFPVYLDTRNGVPATFGVTTRQGGAGILQILELERGTTGGMRIRYRALAPPAP